MERGAREFDEMDDGGGAMSLDRAMAAVRKRLKLVAAIPVVAALLVAGAVSLMQDRFEASAIVQIDPRQKSITQLDSVVSDLKGDTATIESEVEVVKSRPIVLQVIETLDLRNDPEFNAPGMFSTFLAALGIADKQAASERQAQRPRDQLGDIMTVETPGATRPEMDEIADAFLRRLKVTRVRNTLLLDIRFSAADAGKAARIANTIAETYLADQLQSKSRAASTATKALELKLEELRGKLAAAERSVAQWKARNNVFDTEGQSLSEKQLARLMEQTVIARNATTEARAKYDQAQALARTGDTGTTIVEVLQSHTVRLLKEQYVNASRRAAELRTKYGPKHPEMAKVTAEVAETNAQLKAEIAKLVTNLKNEVAVAEERERQLTVSLNDLKDQQNVTKDASSELHELEREAATSKQLFEALLTRYKQTAETQGFQLADVRIIEKADAPQYPASPKRKQLVLMAAMGGLVMGLGFAVLLELMASGISRQEDIERVFDADHLSSVPSPTAADASMPATKSVRLVVAEPQSVYADAIRNARRELDLRRAHGAPRLILVTSSVAGEGAELIASNLAHNYAMTGAKPLLIDGDFRLQPLTRLLAGQRQIGLFDQLSSQRAVEDAILRDGLTGLHFLPASGPVHLRQSIPEILNSAAMGAALDRLKSQFDTVIMSVPPLMPVMDGRLLADYADQIVFVVAWQRTPKQLAKTAVKTLGRNERKLAGVVLNDVAPEQLDETRGWNRGFMAASSRGSDGRGQYAA